MMSLSLHAVIAFIHATRLWVGLLHLVVRVWKAELFLQTASSVGKHFLQACDEIVYPNVLIVGILLNNLVHHLRLTIVLALYSLPVTALRSVVLSLPAPRFFGIDEDIWKVTPCRSARCRIEGKVEIKACINR